MHDMSWRESSTYRSFRSKRQSSAASADGDQTVKVVVSPARVTPGVGSNVANLSYASGEVPISSIASTARLKSATDVPRESQSNARMAEIDACIAVSAAASC